MSDDMDSGAGAILFPGQGAQALGMGLDIVRLGRESDAERTLLRT